MIISSEDIVEVFITTGETVERQKFSADLGTNYFCLNAPCRFVDRSLIRMESRNKQFQPVDWQGDGPWV